MITEVLSCQPKKSSSFQKKWSEFKFGFHLHSCTIKNFALQFNTVFQYSHRLFIFIIGILHIPRISSNCLFNLLLFVSINPLLLYILLVQKPIRSNPSISCHFLLQLYLSNPSVLYIKSIKHFVASFASLPSIKFFTFTRKLFKNSCFVIGFSLRFILIKLFYHTSNR